MLSNRRGAVRRLGVKYPSRRRTTMEYPIQIYTGDPAGWEALSADEQAAISREYMQINEDPGVRGGAQLGPAASATTVRVENGSALTTDGPFAETKEALGGYWVLEADA